MKRMKRQLFFAIIIMAIAALICACAAAPAAMPAAPAAMPAATSAPVMPANAMEMQRQEAGYGYDMVAAPAPALAAEAAPAAAPAAAPQMAAGATTETAPSGAQSPTQPHMIIRNATIAVTTDAFEANLKHIEEKIAAMGGYIENSHMTGQAPEANQVWGREATVTARIPQEQFEAFLRDVEGTGKVTELYRGSEDVTMQYYDNESRLSTLKVQLERLEAILTKSEKLADVLALETEISRVRYEIESLTTTQRRYAQLVQYATVNVRLTEMMDVQYAPPADDIGSKISNMFISVVNMMTAFVEWLVVVIAGLSPLLVVIAIGIVIAIAIRRKRRKLSAERGEIVEERKPIKRARTKKLFKLGISKKKDAEDE